MRGITKNGHHILINDEVETINKTGTLKEAIEDHYKKTTDRKEVLAEYLYEATPGKGNISFDVGYDKTKKESILEMETMKIVHKTFGGDVTMLC